MLTEWDTKKKKKNERRIIYKKSTPIRKPN